MVESSRAEGKPTMLDEPEQSAHTRWVLGLYWAIRGRHPWGEPIRIEAMSEYLDARGLALGGLFEWLSIADDEALAWMAEQRRREHEQMESRMGRLAPTKGTIGRG